MLSRTTTVLVAGVLTVVTGRFALAADPQQRCAAAKLQAAGKELGGQMRCYAKAKKASVAVDPTCLSKYQGKADAAITKAGGGCLGTVAGIDTAVSSCIGAFLLDVPGNGTCPAAGANVIGKGAKGELFCQAKDVTKAGTFAACDAKEDGKTTAHLPSCVSAPTVAVDIDSCDANITLDPVRHPFDSLRDRPGFIEFSVGGLPDWQAIADDAVWAGNLIGEIHRIDPVANTLTTFSPGFAPCNGMAAGFGSLWAADCGGSRLVRLDLISGAITGQQPTTVGSGGEGLTGLGEGYVWMIGTPGSLIAVDPATVQVVATVAVPIGAVSVAVGFGAVWVADPSTGTVLRIDPSSRVVTATISVGGKPRFLVAGEGAVWVLNQADGSVARIDPASATVAATILVDSAGFGGDIAAGGGSVWTTTFDRPLSRIDATTNRVLEQYVGGQGGDSVSYGFGSVWLTNLRTGTIWRIPY
jgi:virginiamycin B lyase